MLIQMTVFEGCRERDRVVIMPTRVCVEQKEGEREAA